MDDILNSSMGEPSSKIRASFKKTVQVKSYETEVIECETELILEEALTGLERVFVTALLHAQLEYEAFINLHFKGWVSDAEFEARKTRLVNSVNIIKSKAESMNVDISRFIK